MFWKRLIARSLCRKTFDIFLRFYSCDSNCIWVGQSFFPGVNNLQLHVTCSGDSG